MAKEWIAEPIEFQYLRNNVSFYLENPLEYPGQLPHYTCEDLPGDLIVWTLYEPWRKSNPWIKKECHIKIQGNQAAGLIGSLSSDYF